MQQHESMVQNALTADGGRQALGWTCLTTVSRQAMSPVARLQREHANSQARQPRIQQYRYLHERRTKSHYARQYLTNPRPQRNNPAPRRVEYQSTWQAGTRRRRGIGLPELASGLVISPHHVSGTWYAPVAQSVTLDVCSTKGDRLRGSALSPRSSCQSQKPHRHVPSSSPPAKRA